MIEIISKKSFFVRDKLGLTGGKINKIKKFIFSLYTITDIEKQIADKSVYAYFDRTNKYLKELKLKYKLNA